MELPVSQRRRHMWIKGGYAYLVSSNDLDFEVLYINLKYYVLLNREESVNLSVLM